MMFTPPVTQAQRLQHVEPGLDLLHRIGGEGDANGVADAGPEQIADADGRLDGAATQSARLGDAQMDRAIDHFGQLVVSGHGHEHVRRLAADLELVEIQVLQDAGVEEGALHHRVGTGFAVLLQKVPFQRAGVHADAHGAAVVPRRLHDLPDPRRRADVARIDTKARGAGLGRFDAAFVVEMDVGHEGDLGGLGDHLERPGGVLVGAGDADDVRARFLQLAHLGDGRFSVRRQGVSHRLDADRGVAADFDRADSNLSGRAAIDSPPGAMVRSFYGHGGKIGSNCDA